jgi:hypothetical protein
VLGLVLSNFYEWHESGLKIFESKMDFHLTLLKKNLLSEGRLLQKYFVLELKLKVKPCEQVTVKGRKKNFIR